MRAGPTPPPFLERQKRMFEKFPFLFDIVIIAAAAVIIWALLQINHAIFRHIQKKYSRLHLRFFERTSSVIIVTIGVLLVFSIWGGFNSVWKTLIGGTAIISAVLVFTAQDIIKDVLAGLMLSINKPFEIGNRIKLEDGTTGIVTDITLRHVVLLKIDSVYTVIPNSKLNAMGLINYSYQTKTCSAEFDFHVAYNSDVEKTMRVIGEAVRASEYSIPGRETGDGADYAPVYFMAYEDSSLRFSTTVYFAPSTPQEILISDINVRVNRALKENGIEIPYTYINVIQHSEE